MLSKVHAAAVRGVEALRVEVEVHGGPGEERVVMVGLPDAAVRESIDRVSTALTSSGYRPPPGKTTINLAPADLRKEGPSFDLAIALAWLMASEQSSIGDAANYIGELSLTGKVRRVKGVLPVALQASAEERRGLLVPPDNTAEAAVVEDLEVIPVDNLREAADFLAGTVSITPTHVNTKVLFQDHTNGECDLSEVKGQETVKRALEIAAAGGHNLSTAIIIYIIYLYFNFHHQMKQTHSFFEKYYHFLRLNIHFPNLPYHPHYHCLFLIL